MTKSTKKKHVFNELIGDRNSICRKPEDDEKVVCLVAGKGSNLHEVEEIFPDPGSRYLVSMPSKFRKTVWVKRGQYLIVQPLDDDGTKVKAEIVEILTKKRMNFLREAGICPTIDIDDTPTSDNDEYMSKNLNRIQNNYVSSSSDSES